MKSAQGPRVVLDTNVLVSALWTPRGNPSTIIGLMLSGKIIPHFDYRIMAEYRNVLRRPKLSFPDNDVEELLAEIEHYGLYVAVKPSSIPMIDETDRKFFDVAKACEAFLITGNKRHYPQDSLVITPAEFISDTYKSQCT
ncbi:PIN domain-containing protein [Spirochaetia bacterium]|nr:PIN domain-containing protein [Spirochaetia bacterium]GHU58528.1 PIN domain-containing protein [Spirochaetia bacterium]